MSSAKTQLASSLCLLRGSLHLRLSSLALAKESLMQALLLDVKNYEAFRELVEGSMMSSSEGSLTIYHIYKGLMVEWEFINNLSYRSQLSEEQSHFVKLIYRTKLKKVSLYLRIVSSELTNRIYTFAKLLKLEKS
jgi:anaphase-promoting complex subunit 6